VARKLTSFVPVISQLEALHSKGFVHGDIRGFNVVFGKTDEEGWLIDFDFGGKLGRKYPKGYRTALDDFRRCKR
jgi:tRNA A-37 threonylcarbamoyl transferase component Bud32